MKLARVIRPGTLEEIRSWLLADRPPGSITVLKGCYYVLVDSEHTRVAAIALRRITWYATEVRHLIVAPEKRRQGYGRAVLRLALEKIRSPIAVATVRADNSVARSLFGGEGFGDLLAFRPKQGVVHFMAKSIPVRHVDQARISAGDLIKDD